MVGEVQTYPQIMGETLGEKEDLREWELRPNGKRLDIGIALRERRQDEETRHQIEEELKSLCQKTYAINEKLSKGLWAEHWTVTGSKGQQDRYNLACMDKRCKECLKENNIIAIDDKNKGRIVCIETVGDEGAVTGIRGITGKALMRMKCNW